MGLAEHELCSGFGHGPPAAFRRAVAPRARIDRGRGARKATCAADLAAPGHRPRRNRGGRRGARCHGRAPEGDARPYIREAAEPAARPGAKIRCRSGEGADRRRAVSLDLASLDDAELAALSIAGRDAAFAEIMRRHREPVYRIIAGNIGDPDEALDLVQETFVAAHRALARYEPDRPMRRWLATIALNT